MLYLSAKIPLAVLSRVERVPALQGTSATRIARPWAMALLAAFAGLTFGIFFLSFAYHYVLWIYIGLTGALYSAVRRHDPELEVRFGARDALIVLAIDLAIIVSVFLYTKWALR